MNEAICSTDRRLGVVSAVMLIVAVASSASFGEIAYQVKAAHPRLFIEDVQELAQRCAGPLAGDYEVVKQRADAAVRRGEICRRDYQAMGRRRPYLRPHGQSLRLPCNRL